MPSGRLAVQRRASPPPQPLPRAGCPKDGVHATVSHRAARHALRCVRVGPSQQAKQTRQRGDRVCRAVGAQGAFPYRLAGGVGALIGRQERPRGASRLAGLLLGGGAPLPHAAPTPHPRRTHAAPTRVVVRLLVRLLRLLGRRGGRALCCPPALVRGAASPALHRCA